MTETEIRNNIRRARENDDQGSWSRLLRQFDGLMNRFVNRYAAHHEREDLEAAARQGLIEAVRSFDFERGTKFVTYLYPCLLGSLTKARRADWLGFGPTINARQQIDRMDRARQDFFAAKGREPSAAELAVLLDRPVPFVEDLLAQETRMWLVHLQIRDEGDERRIDAADLVGVRDPGHSGAKVDLDRALGTLPARSRFVLIAHELEGRPLTDLARDLHVTRSMAGYIYRDAVRAMRIALTAAGYATQ